MGFFLVAFFALGLHSGGEKWDLKKLSDLTANFFMQKYEFFALRFAVAVRSAPRICRQNLGLNELQPVVMVSHIST